MDDYRTLYVQESSYKYWPAAGEMSHVGEYTVDLLTEEALEGFTIRSISILDGKVWG